MKTLIFKALLLICLSGCEQAQNLAERFPKPDLQLNAGTIVELEPGVKASVFGPDMCETGFEDDDPSDDLPGCTTLTGNEFVDITLVFEDGSTAEETWLVRNEDSKYVLVRPNRNMVGNSEEIK